MLFGKGIDDTPDMILETKDLTIAPELLEYWLSIYFQDVGWDVKKLIKKIVLYLPFYTQTIFIDYKITFRLRPTKSIIKRPPYRLPAEMVRDNVLKISGCW